MLWIGGIFFNKFSCKGEAGLLVSMHETISTPEGTEADINNGNSIFRLGKGQCMKVREIEFDDFPSSIL